MKNPILCAHRLLNKGIITILLIAFIFSGLPQIPAEAQDIRLPVPGVRISVSPLVDPPVLKGIKVHPDGPFRFDFILDKGDSGIADDQLKSESTKLIKYFLASITVPEKDLWVNLSPYEKDRIIPQSFGLTEMGRDLLAEDYMLKQITASLIYPEEQVGKKFWKRIYAEAAKKYGTTNIPVNTFNKVWIIPEKAVVYENAKAGTAYVVESKLKVMLEEDYLSLQKHSDVGAGSQPAQERAGYEPAPTVNNLHSLASQIVREVVIPELTTEINEGKNFAQLRQVYNSLILATWYKKKIKDSILAQVYADRNKVAGVEPLVSLRLTAKKPSGDHSTILGSKSPDTDIEFIYQRYLKAFKKGAYNYIKEEPDPVTQEIIPRKYFSGGMAFNKAMTVNLKIVDNKTASPAMRSSILNMITRGLLIVFSSLALSGDHNSMPLEANMSVPKQEMIQLTESERNEAVNLVFKASEEEKLKNIRRFVELLVWDLQGKIVFKEYRGDLNNSLYVLIPFIEVPSSLGTPLKLSNEFIRQGGLKILFNSLMMKKGNKDKKALLQTLLYDILIQRVPDSTRREIVRELLNLKEDKESLLFQFSSWKGHWDKQLSSIIIEECGGIKSLLSIYENEPANRVAVIQLLRGLVNSWPDNVAGVDQIMAFSQRLISNPGPLIRSEAVKLLKDTIRFNPQFNDVASQIHAGRKPMSMLSDTRGSKQVRVAVVDDFSWGGHGVSVLSTLVSTVLKTKIDLQSRTLRRKVCEENHWDKDIDNPTKIAELLLQKEGVLLNTFNNDEHASFGKYLESHPQDTTLVSMSFGDYRITKENTTYDTKLPDLVNGTYPSNLFTNLQGKDTLFIFAAGNDSRPRIYTHPLLDNILPVGAAELQTDGAWRQSDYSSYGLDTKVYTQGIAPNGQVGTSFAAPGIAGQLAVLLTQKESLSIKGGLQELNQARMTIKGQLGEDVNIIRSPIDLRSTTENKKKEGKNVMEEDFAMNSSNQFDSAMGSESTLLSKWLLKNRRGQASSTQSHSRAMNGQEKRGGIDLTSQQFLQTQNSGGEIKFHIDSAMMAQLQASPGFEARIISIQPLESVAEFLGIRQNDGVKQILPR